MAKITEYIEILLLGKDLDLEQAQNLLDTIFEGGVADVQIAAFLTAMRAKNATATELAGFATSLRRHAVRVRPNVENIVDNCGTGGGKVKTGNISTAAALVASGAGVYMAKHGNRAITSTSGSADVLEQLGVKIDASTDTVAKCIEEARIGFMFAPKFHPAMKYVQPVRKNLGFRTAFNILGPLANPAGVKKQVIGVAEEHLMRPIAEALKLLGSEHIMVVNSYAIDEINTASVTKIIELKNGEIMEKQLDAQEFGIPRATIEQLSVNDCRQSADILRKILAEKEPGPRRDIVVINAAAAIIVAGLAEDFPAAIDMAKESITQGKAMQCLEKLVEVSNKS